MVDFFGAPLHPAVVHVPAAASLFAAAALAVAAFRRERGGAWTVAAALLLLATLFGLIAAALTGRAWADALGLLPPGALLPGPSARAGLLRRHALLGASGTALTLLALLLALRAKRGRSPLPALAAAALAAAAVWIGAHAGGVMVHTLPPDAPASAGAH